jgi:hypothetical protein
MSVTITREPLVYERRGPNSKRSYFQDRFNAEIRKDAAAVKRLERHAVECRVEEPKLQARLAEAEGVEYRVNPSRETGHGSTFAPPLWANEFFATAPRPKRVLASMIPSFDLPDGVGSVNLPRIKSGTEAGTQPDLAPGPNRDMADAAVESPAMVVDGNADVALQALEQSPLGGAHLDHALLRDLGEAADAKLEERLFNGTGENKQITGILNLPTGAGGVSAVTYTNAAPKGYEVITELGKVGGQLGDARNCPPEVWLMRTARWCWIGSALDLENLPLAVPGHQAIPPVAYTFDENRPAVAPPILGFPTYLDDAIPATLGEGKNQDCIVAIRPTDMMLFESTVRSRVALDVLSGSMEARFSLHRYAAVLWRYPTAISTLTGTGLVVQAGE